MQTNNKRKVVPPALQDLVEDSRLGRLFSSDARHCALQLWILQIKHKETVENRIVYGRLVPYRHSNNRWSSKKSPDFRVADNIRVTLTRLNLYVTSTLSADVLRLLSTGRTLAAVSEELNLDLTDAIKTHFGMTALNAGELVYRPVSYLLNRNAQDRSSLTSPHGNAGALSASISQTDKGALFRLDHEYDVAMTHWIVKQINAETGLDFGLADVCRFGDIELLVFPTLDDFERTLLKIKWAENQDFIIIQFDPLQVSHFSGFQFRLNIQNGGQIVHSVIGTAEHKPNGKFELSFRMSDDIRSRTDSTELEIFGFEIDKPQEGTLCCRWKVGYIREIAFQAYVVRPESRPVHFDWLEKKAKPSFSDRVKTTLTINQRDLGFNSLIGGSRTDPWVRVNSDFSAVFARLHPRLSNGRFFLCWNQGDGDGRIRFTEWFKALLEQHKQSQVIIFDPYFGGAGLGLILLCAQPKSDYIVFRSLSKSFQKSDGETQASEKPTSNGVDNLIASCEQNRKMLKRGRLRIFGMKDGRLHDRYILIVGSDGLPIVGFNLSNSLQTAAENYPLLITPIPADVLLDVERYQLGLVQEACKLQSDSDMKHRPMQMLFDSESSAIIPPRYEPLAFLEKTQAGDVLSAWANEASLLNLKGESLRQQMTLLSMLKDNLLILPLASNLATFLAKKPADDTDFGSTWEILGELLANSHAGDHDSDRLDSESAFLAFLSRFLDKSFHRDHSLSQHEYRIIDSRLFADSFETFLHSSNRIEHMYHPVKYAALTWPEYFAIKLMWRHTPLALIAIAEYQMANAPVDPQIQDSMRLSLLSQIISEISLSVQFKASERQRDCLLNSSNGLLRWAGLNAVERQLRTLNGLALGIQKVKDHTYTEQVQALGWMVQRTAKNPEDGDIYGSLVSALHAVLPANIVSNDLRQLVDSMRGHMRTLCWAEPWLFRDVVSPLLEGGRANIDDACEIWIQELADWLRSEDDAQPLLFDLNRQGQTTNIAAFLFANSTITMRQNSMRSIREILRRQKIIVHQPLASTSDWTRWDRALVIAMWILSFCKFGQFYLLKSDMADADLNDLSKHAHELAMVRPIDEWRVNGPGRPSDLAAFYEKAEQLLASTRSR
ncbi:VPA1262 family protein [Lichenicola sp.]|uniref:VPA1262 family protein n=1 Tax=Lichenicola sp. TaxID=2804529 RepID=UPI003AFFB3C4